MEIEYVYDTALAIFRKQGIRTTRMGDLATYLQISKRILYERFPSKEVFLLACIRHEIEKEQEIISRLKQKAYSPLKQIAKLYSHVIRFFQSFHPSFFKDLRKYPESDKELDKHILSLRNEFNDLLYDGIISGLCTKDCDTFLFSTFLIFRLEEIKNGTIFQPEKIRGSISLLHQFHVAGV